MTPSQPDPQGSSLTRFAWVVLGVTVVVIVFGGFVRATGSGAGCGSHWPLCNGDVVPRSASLETLIEYTHRITSGLDFLLVLVLLVAVLRTFPAGAPVRKAAWASMSFMLLEALIGAGLVLLEFVAYNESIARAYWMGAHLTNTFLLLGSLVLTVWFLCGGERPVLSGQGPLLWVSIPALLGWFALGWTGAVAALGDTLAIGGGISPEESPIVATLVGLRIIHPLASVLVALLLAATIYVGLTRRAGLAGRRLGLWLGLLLIVQVAVGVVNVWLRAPIALQMTHLLLTNLIWIAFVWFTVTALTTDDRVLGPSAAFVPN